MNQRFLTIDGRKVFYLEGGEGEPLVFFHGIWASSELYIPLLKMLSEKYHIYALDFPGFGKSFTPDKIWGYMDFSQFVLSFVKKLELGEFTLVAQSGGGGVGIVFTSLYPKYIKKLVLMDSVYDKTGFAKILKGIFLKTSRRLFLLEGFSGLFLVFKSIYFFFLNLLRHGFYSFKVLSASGKDDLTEYAKKIRKETLLLWGEHDYLFPIDYAKRLNKLIPYSKLKIINGDHDWCMLHPEKIKEFL